jgi:ribosomal protein S18 acetylase RimI-like enzyme
MKEIDFEEFSLKKLDKTEMVTLVSWAEKEGWNPGPYDAEVFYNTDPDGHYGFFLNGEMIAGGSVVSYSGQFGFMGLFIVKPEYRSSGIGRKLWYQRRDLLLSRLVKGAVIGMDGVVAMQPFYSRGGFVSAFTDERHEIKGGLYTPDPYISAIIQNDYNEIIHYDSVCFGLPRPQFLVPWMNIPGNVNLKYNAGGHLKGFVVMRKAQNGYKIGPLFADNAIVAQALYESCLSTAPGEAVYLDISSENVAAVEMTKRFNTRFVFECARMYYGQPPDIAIDKVFGITTFELG